MLVQPLAIRNKRVSELPRSLLLRFTNTIEMDQDTFDIMWEMSKPGGEAEGCFFRIPHTDHFTVDVKDHNPTRGLPDVSL